MSSLMQTERGYYVPTTSHDKGVVTQETDPVHDEDLVNVESLLQQFGCDGHRVEVAETPETAAKRGKTELSCLL